MRRTGLIALLLLLLVPAPATAADWPSTRLELGLADQPGGAAALERSAKVRRTPRRCARSTRT